MLTLPNLISALRIAMIPVFWALIVDDDTTAWGVVLFVAVVATDWVDGTIARRTGQVSELGKVLDPVADRLAVAAGLIALVVRGAFPMWAAALILARDIAVLAGGALLAVKGSRIDVRWIGKVATFGLMIAIPAVAWGTLGLWPAAAALAIGWPIYAIAVVEYYLAAGAYALDLRRALAAA
ncbi:MAG TPA: CDP-alcohol phosphatidyltransferase family protein [Actinomycetota bacterium]|nr:CDP-alcohol phosphatidyltransferase family protein [Actinomycetota bacterium]